jgi:hypothetical protein
LSDGKEKGGEMTGLNEPYLTSTAAEEGRGDSLDQQRRGKSREFDAISPPSPNPNLKLCPSKV